MMLEALVMLSVAAEEQKDHTAFYVAGGVLAGWAVLVSFIGIRGHERWPSDGAATAIMAITAVLVVAACATAVVTA
jgi:hypothetical protein